MRNAYPPKIKKMFALYGALDDFTEKDFVDLAMAALDQAGLTVREQTKVHQLIQSFGHDEWTEPYDINLDSRRARAQSRAHCAAILNVRSTK